MAFCTCNWPAGSPRTVAAASPAGSMCVTIRVTPGKALPHGPLELGRLAVGLVQPQRIAHFQVQFQPPLPVLFINADAMGAQAVPGGQQADNRGYVFRAGGNRLDVDHHVGAGLDRRAAAASTWWAMSCARSKAAACPTASVTSAKIAGPLRRSRSRVTSSTPGTCLAAAGNVVLQAGGHTVQQVVHRLFGPAAG